MKKYLAVLGLFCAVAPLAKADDVGVVMAYDGPRITVRMGLMVANVGEEVRLTVIPERRQGYGRGVVTDVDRYTHLVGVVLMPLEGAAATGSPETGTVHGNLRLFRGDTLRVDGLERYIENPPEFRVERPVIVPTPAPVDIMMPFYVPSTGRDGRTGASAAPAARPAGPAGSMPDVDALLRSLEGNAAAPANRAVPQSFSPNLPGALRPQETSSEEEEELQKVARNPKAPQEAK